MKKAEIVTLPNFLAFLSKSRRSHYDKITRLTFR